MERMQVWCLLLVLRSAMEMAVLIQGQDQNQGFISIDCGAPNDYYEPTLQINYKADEGFTDSGKNMQVSNEYIHSGIYQMGKNMRVFPNGARNCYTLRTDKGKDNTYLVRALFLYGNYDNKNQTPVFDLYIGVNYWATINTSRFIYEEIIYVPPADDIQVCLVNTGNGVPFISALELRLLNNSIYQLDSGSLVTHRRYDIGGSNTYGYRYPQDVYDRIWRNLTYDWESTNTTSTPTLSYNNDDYKVPAEVLSTAQKAADVNSSLSLSWPVNINYKWCIYFHFAELESLPHGQRREFDISVNDVFIDRVALEYLKPVTKSSASAMVTGPYLNFSIKATEQSWNYPPILNAMEIFWVAGHPNIPTSLDDVDAIHEIKRMYSVNRDSWQGDPCAPSTYAWDGLNCSYDNTPRIMSLNLSSSKLSGNVTAAFSNLLALVSLDLSENQLTGPVPESLAKLPNLTILNLSGNNLTGSIPEDLQKKVDNKSLQLSVANNPNLCVKNPCKPRKKGNSFIIPVIAAASVSVANLLIVPAIIWRNKSRKGKGLTEGTIKSKSRPFTYKEVLKITDNFKTVIGEGGFGKVYLGTLADCTRVAVKMLSRTSRQGYREFQAEAQLLMIVHHRNLVSLIGYCDDVDNMALIYEYMANGNLRQHLSDQSINSHVLTWNERIRIAVDAAQGLDYLHNGCKPPIIHRDMKTANILLNESMQAKIADFGLSKAFTAENDSHISTRPAGTPGYLDPEFHSSGKLNRKSDVYSFGVILFELITGYPAMIRSANGNVSLLQWVIPIVEGGDIQSIVDARLDGRFNVNSAWKLVETAMSCVPATAIQRPDMSHVLAELKECWEMETRSWRMGSSNRRSSESFEMMSGGLDDVSSPIAR